MDKILMKMKTLYRKETKKWNLLEYAAEKEAIDLDKINSLLVMK